MALYTCGDLQQDQIVSTAPDEVRNQTAWDACEDHNDDPEWQEWCQQIKAAAVRLTEHDDALCRAYGEAILQADADDRILFGAPSAEDGPCYVTEPTWEGSFLLCSTDAYDFPGQGIDNLTAHEGCHLNDFFACKDRTDRFTGQGLVNSADYEADRCTGNFNW